VLGKAEERLTVLNLNVSVRLTHLVLGSGTVQDWTMEVGQSSGLVGKKLRRTTPEERLRWVQRYLASGLTHREFCRRYGVGHNSLSEWKREARQHHKQALAFKPKDLSEGAPLLKEVSLGSVLGQTHWAGEMSFPSGLVLRVSAELPHDLLKAMIEAALC
jgi:transposase-like protein